MAQNRRQTSKRKKQKQIKSQIILCSLCIGLLFIQLLLLSRFISLISSGSTVSSKDARTFSNSWITQPDNPEMLNTD